MAAQVLRALFDERAAAAHLQKSKPKDQLLWGTVFHPGHILRVERDEETRVSTLARAFETLLLAYAQQSTASQRSKARGGKNKRARKSGEKVSCLHGVRCVGVCLLCMTCARGDGVHTRTSKRRREAGRAQSK